MLALFEFPARYTATGQPAKGSIDEVRWLAADRKGADTSRVPPGAALYIRGWALDPGTDRPATAVVVTVDGVRTHEARVGLARPDVAEALENNDLATVGYEALIPTGGLIGGGHRITVSAVDPVSRSYANVDEGAAFSMDGTPLPPDLRYDPAGCSMTLDEVRDESRKELLAFEDGRIVVPRGSILYMRGWACDNRSETALGGAYAIVDGERAYEAEYGLLREDVADVRRSPALTDVGFFVHVPTAGLDRGVHQLEIVGVDRAREALLRGGAILEVTVGEPIPARLALSEQTAAFIDSAVRIHRAQEKETIAPLRVRRGDRVFVHGWAIDEARKTLAGGVVLLLDDRVEIRTLYGLKRPDVAQRFGDLLLERCGFSAEIDTVGLPDGMHSVRCRVIASDGRGTLETAQRFDFEVSELS